MKLATAAVAGAAAPAAAGAAAAAAHAHGDVLAELRPAAGERLALGTASEDA